jgi:hypothetical protein
MDGPDLSIPVQISDLIWGDGSGSDGLDQAEEGGAHRLGFRRASPLCCVLETPTGDVLVVLQGKEVDDEVQGVTASSYAWSRLSFASGNGAGRRLETRQAEAIFWRPWRR